MYEIEKNVPIPANPKANRFPYHELEVGDSFLVTGVKPSSIHGSNYRMSKKLGKVFIGRKEGESIRVWRTE